MVLDFGSFTRRGLLVDHVFPADTLGRNKARKEQKVLDQKGQVEDRETTNLSAMGK